MKTEGGKDIVSIDVVAQISPETSLHLRNTCLTFSMSVYLFAYPSLCLFLSVSQYPSLYPSLSL